MVATNSEREGDKQESGTIRASEMRRWRRGDASYPTHKKDNAKLAPKWEGHFTILEAKSPMVDVID